MPTYEYKCNNCEEIFERFHKITDPPLKECPVCGGELKRLISGGIGVIFKGSGFYVTDSKGAKNSSSTPKESNTSDSGITDNSKETKVSTDSKDIKKKGPSEK
jgi:putative FmdB family regulatory protein